MDFFTQRRFNARAVFDFNNLTPQIKSHVTNVYLLLAACVATFSASIYVNIANLVTINSIAAHFVSFMLLMYITVTSIMSESNRNHFWRTAALLGFAFLEGTQVSDLVEVAFDIDPSIVFTAAATTAAIFASFSMAALLSERRSFMYLGGFLMSSINYLLLFSMLAWLFPGLRNMYLALSLYGGLALFSGYIIYDTQLMVEKAAMLGKEADTVIDAASLFINIVAIFIRILVILIKQSAKKKSEK